MQPLRRQQSRMFVIFVALLLAATEMVSGQDFSIDDLQLPGLLGDLAAANVPTPGLKVHSQISLSEGSNVGLLTIEVSMNKSWKIYSMTQPGGPPATKIHLQPTNRYRLLGSFTADHPPKVAYSEEFEMDIETFGERVSWSVPIEVSNASSGVAIHGHLEGLACESQCVQLGESNASFVATVANAKTDFLKGHRLEGTHADVRTWMSSSQARPGDAVQLFVAFHADPTWHVYAYEKVPASDFQKPTLVNVALAEGWTQGDARSTAAVIANNSSIPGEPPVREYAGPSTIAIPILIPADAAPGNYPLSGHVAFQTCSTQCDRPIAFVWQAMLNVTPNAALPPVPGVVQVGPPAKYDDVVGLLTATEESSQEQEDEPPKTSAAFDISETQFAKVSGPAVGLGRALVAAFFGGFILNFMPCVLPVIGLKIMSFVDQAGHDRRKIFQLNLSYVLGMLAVFWVLASLAAAPALDFGNADLGWGAQFNYQGFAISLVCIVFVMALSFLGVWEIPIPGFATGRKATELSTRGGVSGAFFKGSITTLLATPCSAPGLITAYAFAVNSRSSTVPFLVFTAMGLGMGFPYLLIGAFPNSIRVLPKPGAWMDTFKQLMGFVLLATVVFLMQNLAFTNLLPTIGLLFGLWFACWWIGRVPFTAARDQRMRAWAWSAVIGMLTFVVCFGPSGLVGHAENKLALQTERTLGKRLDAAGGSIPAALVSHSGGLPWEPFRRQSLNRMIDDGETVMVDFTADWCLVCRRLEAKVLNSDPVREAVQANGVRTVVADWGTRDPEIADLLDRLQGSRQIPFLAIFPAGHPEKVIRFSGQYGRGTILEALEQAGASRNSERVASRIIPQEVRPTSRAERTQQLP